MNRSWMKRGLVLHLSVLPMTLMFAQDRSSDAKADLPLEYCSVSLSLAKPKGGCPVAPLLRSHIPHFVAVPLKRIDNPAIAGFSISVDLEAEGTQTIHIGSVGPYPPDRPATFALRVNTGLEKLSRIRNASSKAQIVLEIKVSPTAKKPETLSVDIGPLRWSDEDHR